jgi:hypothetical protein
VALFHSYNWLNDPWSSGLKRKCTLTYDSLRLDTSLPEHSFIFPFMSMKFALGETQPFSTQIERYGLVYVGVLSQYTAVYGP